MQIEERVSKVITSFSDLRINFSSWDFLIFAFLAGVSVAYAFLFVSRGRIVPILVSTYMAFLLVSNAPFLTKNLALSVGISQLFVLKIGGFAIAFAIILYSLSRVIFQSPVGSETFGILGSLALAISQVGFLLAVFISFLPKEITRQFSDLTRQIFLGSDQFFYWAAAPIVILLILGRKINREVG